MDDNEPFAQSAACVQSMLAELSPEEHTISTFNECAIDFGIHTLGQEKASVVRGFSKQTDGYHVDQIQTKAEGYQNVLQGSSFLLDCADSLKLAAALCSELHALSDSLPK